MTAASAFTGKETYVVRSKRMLILAAKIAVAGFLLYYLFQSKDINLVKIGRELGGANLWILPVGVLLTLAGQYLCSVRWGLLLRVLEIHVRVWRLFQYYIIGMFFSNFFPSIIGGDVVKLYYVRRDSGKPLMHVFAGTFLERCGGFIGLLGFGLAGSLYSQTSLKAEDFRPLRWLGLSELPIWILVCALALAFSLFLIILFSQKLYRWTARILEKCRLKAVAEKIEQVGEAMGAYREAPRRLIVPLALSFLNIALFILLNYGFGLSVGLEIPLPALAAVGVIIIVLVMFPISINGLGIRETAFVLFLMPVVGNMPDAASKLVAISFLNLLTTILASVLGALFYSLMKKETALDSSPLAQARAENNPENACWRP